jgi:hypothetical protein
MKVKRAVRVKNESSQPMMVPVETQADSIMAEMGLLYRERLRAHYNNDLPALDKINQQIESLKSKL